MPLPLRPSRLSPSPLLLSRYGLPILTHVVPPEQHRWLPTLIRGAAKAVAVAVAWYLHVMIAAFQSALRGGLMCSRALLRWAHKRGMMDMEEESDRLTAEAFGYFLCAVGFYMQASAARWPACTHGHPPSLPPCNI